MPGPDFETKVLGWGLDILYSLVVRQNKRRIAGKARTSEKRRNQDQHAI